MEKWESRRRERKREFVQPSVRLESSIEKQYPLSGTSCSSDHPTRLDLPTLVSSSRKRILSAQTWRTKRSCGPGFPRSTPSAGGTPRELSAKRQYALRRRLSIHPDLTPFPWLSQQDPTLSTICNLTARGFSLFLLSFSANLTIFSFTFSKNSLVIPFLSSIRHARSPIETCCYRQIFGNGSAELLKQYHVLWKTFLTIIAKRHKNCTKFLVHIILQ